MWDHLQHPAPCNATFFRKKASSVIFRVFDFLKGRGSFKWEIEEMTHLHFWAFFYLGPFATPCNAPFPRKKYSLPFFRFIFFNGQGSLNKNRKDDPPEFSGVLSFGTICKVICKVTLCHFLFIFFLLLGGFPFFWWNFQDDIHYKRGRIDLYPKF